MRVYAEAARTRDHVRESVVMWGWHVHVRIPQLHNWAGQCSRRAGVRLARGSIRAWYDCAKARQMQAAIDSLAQEHAASVKSGDHSPDSVKTGRLEEREEDEDAIGRTHRMSLFALNVAAELCCRGEPFECALSSAELKDLATSAARTQHLETQNAQQRQQLTSLQRAHSQILEKESKARQLITGHIQQVAHLRCDEVSEISSAPLSGTSVHRGDSPNPANPPNMTMVFRDEEGFSPGRLSAASTLQV